MKAHSVPANAVQSAPFAAAVDHADAASGGSTLGESSVQRSALQMRIDQSPRMVAQRRAMQAALRPASHRDPGAPMVAAPLQARFERAPVLKTTPLSTIQCATPASGSKLMSIQPNDPLQSTDIFSKESFKKGEDKNATIFAMLSRWVDQMQQIWQSFQVRGNWPGKPADDEAKWVVHIDAIRPLIDSISNARNRPKGPAAADKAMVLWNMCSEFTHALLGHQDSKLAAGDEIIQHGSLADSSGNFLAEATFESKHGKSNNPYIANVYSNSKGAGGRLLTAVKNEFPKAPHLELHAKGPDLENYYQSKHAGQVI